LREPRRKRQWARQTRCHASAAGKPKRRVVVTGQGVVTSLGQSTQQFYDQLLAGASGITHIEGFDTSDYSTKIAGEVKSVDAAPYVARKWVKRMDEVMKFMFVAGKQVRGRRAGGIGGRVEDGQYALPAAQHAVFAGVACTARLNSKSNRPRTQALEDAGLPFEGPGLEDLDRKLCGILIGTAMGGMTTFASGVEALTLSGHRKMNPFCIPFSIGNMGGAMLAMDLGFMGPNYSISTACATGNYCHHQRRGPHPRTATPGRGVRLCLERGLAAAGVAPEEVTYVNAHGTSTPAGDVAEFRAIRAVLGHDGLRINSSKGAIGHLLGAAGAVEAVATIQALRTGWLHPNLNLDEPDEGVDASVLVGGVKEQADVKVALSNSFGFGGHNSCVLFRKFEE
ncbi:hypothetical protein APUTEX25_002817, partial [Auxenochlorella protothecoides]